jgi:predicted signal transduction protein with EAL and GGDEF domain
MQARIGRLRRGFGSFFYFKNLAFDYIKIDGEYIRDLATNPLDRLLVEALVDDDRGGKPKSRRIRPEQTT